jgi:hypothetical protein
LKDVIIVLQSHLIMVLQTSVESEHRGTTRWIRLGRNRPRGNVGTDMSGLVKISDNGRLASIRSLAALSQRLSPISRSVAAPLPSFTTNLKYRPRTQPKYTLPASLLLQRSPLTSREQTSSL